MSAVKTKKRSLLRRAGRLFLYLLIASLLYVVLCRWVMPPVTVTQLSSLVGGYGLKRDYVPLSEISPNLVLAAIASEDQLFPDHGGFDWKSMEKSLEGKTGKRKKRTPGAGASTISQQVAKNVFLWQGNGIGRYIRKAPEAFYTKMIEWAWGKKRIIEVYLNVIEMGPGIFGAEAAAQNYFHKSARNLSRAEAAMIIACLPNPKRFTVVPMSSRVKWRYPQILAQMNNLAGDPDIEALMK
jgi:monofunctional biosynthetic peptidoglycan transglycosylase